ncbi:MAG: response regulator transcription factor [Okeania sp. SIO3B5]|uniref:response regulator n=1 Tax=Okeania sp. SIO3B5 TaxID=2607811 RepID=UPI0013FE51D3|nr:response regulator [Okeania sp. SIO3B5]NEO55748.1 response regulator transcription factor [Okeania sp. SIO3B5]
MFSTLNSNNLTSSDLSSLSETTVVVLEDNELAQDAIKEVVEDEFKGNLKVVKSKEEAIEMLEQQQAKFFIFDNYVGQNKQEGLDALEQVRVENKDAFVAIFSAYPKHQQQARNLGCNLFVEKSEDLRACVRYIALGMIQYKFELSMRKSDLKIFSRGFNELVQSSGASQDENSNIEEYEKLKSDPEWLEKNQGKYVVFVDGKLVKISNDNTDESREVLLNWLINKEEYSDKQRFFTKVEIDYEIIDEPSSLWFD